MTDFTRMSSPGSDAQRRAQWRAQWEKERAALCAQWGLTTAQSETLINALPYSDVPSWDDVAYVLRTIKEIWPVTL